MLALRLLATYANLPVMASSAIQQAAVPPSPTSELIACKPPTLLMPNDETAPLAPAGMEADEPKSSVTNRCWFRSKVKPKYVGKAGPGAWVTTGLEAVPKKLTGKTLMVLVPFTVTT